MRGLQQAAAGLHPSPNTHNRAAEMLGDPPLLKAWADLYDARKSPKNAGGRPCKFARNAGLFEKSPSHQLRTALGTTSFRAMAVLVRGSPTQKL